MEENVLLKVNKKYSIKYVLTAKMFEIYLIFIVFIFACWTYGTKKMIIGAVILLIIVALLALILSKKSASKTYIVFYEDKVVFKRKFLFRNTTKEMPYSNIKDIVFTNGTNWITRFFQKIFHLGNIYIYPKKGNILINGISLEVVDNIEKVIEDIRNNVGDRIK